MNTGRVMIALALIATLGACNTQSSADGQAGDDEPTSADTSSQEEGETVSILRPDVEAEQEDMLQNLLEPLNVTIGFPEGGSALDDAAISGLQEVMVSEQLTMGGPIVLRAHSDAGGSDAVNARASEARAASVAEWLTDEGVDPDRIEVIVFGEQNPVEPNALPDGTPNEEGRALNRRVEVLIVPPARDEQGAEQSTEAGD